MYSSMASKPINIRWIRTGYDHTEKYTVLSYRELLTN